MSRRSRVFRELHPIPARAPPPRSVLGLSAPAQPLDLLTVQDPNPSHRQAPEGDASVRDAAEPNHHMSYPLEHASNLPIATFDDDDLDPRILSGADEPGARRERGPSADRNTGLDSSQGLPGRGAADLGEISLRNT